MKNVYTILFVLFAIALNAQTKTWISDDGGVWHDETKWAPEGIPTINDNVVIPSNATLDINQNAVANMITVNAGATMDIHANLSLVESSIFAAGSVVDLVEGKLNCGGVLTVTGMLNVTSELEKGLQGNIVLDIDTPGSINFESGGTGDFVVANFAELKISSGGVMNINEDLSIEAGSFGITARLTNEGTINKTGGLDMTEISVTVDNNDGEWNIQSGSVNLNGPANIDGAMVNVSEDSEMIWSTFNKTVQGELTGVLDGPFTMSQTMIVEGESTMTLDFTGSSQVNWDDFGHGFPGTVVNFSKVNVIGGSSIINGTTFINHGTIDVEVQNGLVFGNAASIENLETGVINVNVSDGIGGSFAAANFLNSGQLNFLVGEGNHTVPANVSNAEGGIVDIGNDNVSINFVNGPGILIGDGAFSFISNLAEFSGNLYPGESVGSINCSGSLTTTPDAVYHLDINGTTPALEHDVFNISQSVSLYGTFDINMGFEAALDDEFVVMTFGDTIVTNLPTTVDLEYDGNVFTFDVIVSDTDVTLRVSNIVVGTKDLTSVLPELIVSPNPSNGRFQMDFGKVIQDLHIQILDITGRVVSSNVYNGQKTIFIDVQSGSGIYLIHISADGEQAVRKIIKE